MCGWVWRPRSKFPCAAFRRGNAAPPNGVVGMALYALNLLVVRQLIHDIDVYRSQVELIVVPPLCLLGVNLFDFSHSAELIARACESTVSWLRDGGMRTQSVPMQLQPHTHQPAG